MSIDYKELRRQVAAYMNADEKAIGPSDFSGNEHEMHSFGVWEGWKRLYSQEYVTALLAALEEKDKRIAELEQRLQQPVEIPAKFYSMAENIRTQDNRVTANPMFCVFQKRDIVVDERYAHDRIVWWHTDGYEANTTKSKRLELLRDDLRNTGEWKRLAVMDVDDFVTCCFTEQGCKDYLACNGHNLKNPFVYVMGGFRNDEYQVIRNWLMSLKVEVEGE